MRLNPPSFRRAQSLLRGLQIVVRLEVHPKLVAVSEIQPESQSGVCGDSAAIVDDLRDPAG
jgi:hypothetical protein